jgi:hypothetical protein
MRPRHDWCSDLRGTAASGIPLADVTCPMSLVAFVIGGRGGLHVNGVGTYRQIPARGEELDTQRQNQVDRDEDGVQGRAMDEPPKRRPISVRSGGCWHSSGAATARSDKPPCLAGRWLYRFVASPPRHMAGRGAVTGPQAIELSVSRGPECYVA